MRKRDGETVFEVFEASSSNEAVYSTQEKLLVPYPGPAVSVPAVVCSTEGFCDNLALFLSNMDVDVLDSAPKTTKAGSTVEEVRDTTDPKYISQLLIGILHGCHGSSNPDVRRITKHVADEVMWKDALRPWRRLPLWLILRVTLQTMLTNEVDYKAFLLYFMAHTLTLCVKDERSYSSDLLFTIRSKTARRFAKLGHSTPAFVQAAVTTVGNRIQTILEQRWTDVQTLQSQSAPWNAPSMEQVKCDTALSLTTSSPYLKTALEHDNRASEPSLFSPSHPRRILGTTDFHAFSGGHLSLAVSTDSPRLVLADFEDCVLRHLNDWVLGLPSGRSTYDAGVREAASVTLLSCFEQYQESARSHYARSHPEDQSITALTLLALWRALDRVAVMEHPLLEGYSPEIPAHLLEPLILRDQACVQFANDIEVYIRNRHTRAPKGAISLFETSSDWSSFALRTFNERWELQVLKREIEDRATRERQNKRQELRRLNNRYNDLKSKASALSCTYVKRYSYWGGRQHVEDRHDGNCHRCQLNAEANGLHINVHEWPLPDNDQTAIMVVFELACPPVFSRWREMTYNVLTSVGKLGSPQTSAEPYKMLNRYEALSSFHTTRSSPFVLASDAKPFVVCHYSQMNIRGDTREDTVCVNNGLIPYLYHSDSSVRLSSQPLSTSSIVYFCSPALASNGPYCHLQKTVDFTTHTSNEVLADQASCPKELNLLEHIAFASMRAGGRLQWLNILRELRAGTVTFSSPDVHHLITQAIWQIGPLTSGVVHRDWHLDLEDSSFSASVLHESRALLESIGENWKETMTVRTAGSPISFAHA